jgi:hypothetical protein
MTIGQDIFVDAIIIALVLVFLVTRGIDARAGAR